MVYPVSLCTLGNEAGNKGIKGDGVMGQKWLRWEAGKNMEMGGL